MSADDEERRVDSEGRILVGFYPAKKPSPDGEAKAPEKK